MMPKSVGRGIQRFLRRDARRGGPPTPATHLEKFVGDGRGGRCSCVPFDREDDALRSVRLRHLPSMVAGILSVPWVGVQRDWDFVRLAMRQNSVSTKTPGKLVIQRTGGAGRDGK